MSAPGKDARALRHALLEADDLKIRRVVAVMDGVTDPRVQQAVLDPLRPRLAVLRPVRPLRFARLLFLPLDPVIVPARAWKPGEPSVPRNALLALAAAARTGLGPHAAAVEAEIAGANADAVEMITRIGETLWPRAAEMLAVAAAPPEWAETGMRLDAWGPLARAVAAVLRRAVPLRRMASDAELGALEADPALVDAILRDAAREPPEACAMLARLVLIRAPHAAPLVRRLVEASRNEADKALLRRAVEHGLERVLTGIEASDAFVEDIAHGGLADAAAEARRTVSLLREIEADPGAAKQRPRLRAIRERLDQACRARFTESIRDDLLVPLADAPGPVAGEDQTRLEHAARELRVLETVARRIGDPAVYDQQLRRAVEVVRNAWDSGVLTVARHLRLTEILAGSEEAEALYWQAKTGQAKTGQGPSIP